MGVSACVSDPRLLMSSGVIWHDMILYDWLNKFDGFYMAAIVNMISRHALSIDVHHGYKLVS